MFIENKLLPMKSIFQIAKLELACYRQMPQFNSDRKMVVAWVKKYAPEGSIDQAMALIEGKRCRYQPDRKSTAFNSHLHFVKSFGKIAVLRVSFAVCRRFNRERELSIPVHTRAVAKRILKSPFQYVKAVYFVGFVN